MYTVSTDYKAQIRNTLRNPSYVKVKLSVVEPDAKTNATITSNGELYFSDVTDVSSFLNISKSYMTLEKNRFVLDGKNPLAPVSGETPYMQNGFVGTDVSDSDGSYSTAPKITVDFGIYEYDFIGLTIDFDTILNEYPSSIEVIAYNNTVSVFDETYVVDTATGFKIFDPIPTCDKIEIISLGSTIPYRRFRLQSLVFGLANVYTNEDITSLTWKQSGDIINSKLPQVSLDYTVFDLSSPPIYDPDNPTGIYVYLQERQPAELWFGYELDDSTIEWVECANLFTTGEFNFKSKGSIPTVEFKSKSLLNIMTDTYKEGIYTGTTVTLYDLANDIISSYGLPNDKDGNVMYSVDTALQSYSTLMPLPVKPANELLQLIANAGLCVLYTDRNGHIIIEPKSTTEETFVFDKSNIYEVPDIKKYPTLKGIDTLIHNLEVGASASELIKQTITGASATDYEFDYELATDISAVGAVTYTKRTVTATASSQRSLSYTPAMSINGSTSDGWQSANKTLPQYITYDLSTNYPVAKVNVMINVAGYVPEVFDIQVSTDGTNFTTVYANATVSVTGTSFTEFTFNAVTARYVRLNMKSNANGSYFIVTEAEVYSGDGLFINGTPSLYGRYGILNLTGTGTLTISGKKIDIKTQPYALEINADGERCSVINELITSSSHAFDFATWVGEYLGRKNQYTISDRGFPEVDALDNLLIDTVYTDNVRADVLSTEIKFDGALSGKTVLIGE